METVVLDGIQARLPREELMRKLHVGEDSPQAVELLELIDQAEAIGRPKGLCGVAFVDDRGDDFVVIDGERFSSRVLAVNLSPVNRVFPYLATCGTELEEWANGLDDMLLRYWAEAIRESAMRCAMAETERFVKESYAQDETSRMSPGSLEDWPIQQQVPLFRLLGETESTIGVRLTESLLMVPTKTVSGIRFGAESGFESCMLCPRPVCQNRRAPYDAALFDSRYRKSAD
ncbi:MAG TPA: vitamin B12 dependent-methionine synthase activation domain-containing protein [Chloroflexota bacterium]|nr:vitamin B12 dependent-methionine synthase activation domain-containing protein [Chloroflexota bacterium]HEX2987189.1 vitamin B12 dependent-methionine synthase activation domain-containing protein [Chloroflexota bacterium]